MENIIREVLRRTEPNLQNMANLTRQHLDKGLTIVSEPCGAYIISKTMFKTFLETAGLDESITKEIAKNMPAAGRVITNPFYLTLLCYLLSFLADDKYEDARNTARLYSVITASYLKRKYLHTSCDPALLAYTLQHLHGASLAKEGFAKLVLKVADETFDVWSPKMLAQVEVYSYYRYLVDIRNKLNQSIKLISRKYYEYKTSKNTQNYDDLADKIMINFEDLLQIPEVISEVHKTIGMPEEEADHLFTELLTTSDAQSSIRDVVKYILIKYEDIEKIQSGRIEAILYQCARTEDLLVHVLEVLDAIHMEHTQNNIHAIILISIMLIRMYR